MVGAGAAGLMAAIAAARSGPSLKILLIDTRNKIGAKILISGGTRCNVTNVKVRPSDYEGGAAHFVRHVLEAFTPEETIGFFREIGVTLVLEPTGKYFPTTHSGKTVLEALVKETGRLGVELRTGLKISRIRFEDGIFYLGENETLAARKVILATGGLSYPETGSDGTGLAIAKSFGHLVTETAPSLTPLTTDDEDWKTLSGIAFEARLSFFKNGKKEAESKGPFLFTHFGFSGPAALDLSRHVALARQRGEPFHVIANFLPEETVESFGKKLKGALRNHPRKQLKTVLTEEGSLPERFAEIFLKKTGSKNSGQVTHALLNWPLPVSGVVGYKKAEVTAGGVALGQVRVSTMESRLVPGLYFAGEILDADGRIGGFNFQWAWSTGRIAGSAAARFGRDSRVWYNSL